MVILACPILFWHLDILSSCLRKLLFNLCLGIPGASVLDGFAKPFFAIHLSVLVNSRVLSALLQFLCIFGFCNKDIAKTSKMVNILSNCETPVNSIDTAEFLMPRLTFSISF